MSLNCLKFYFLLNTFRSNRCHYKDILKIYLSTQSHNVLRQKFLSDNFQNPNYRNISLRPLLISAGILSFFKKDDEETPEQKLITTIKRSILCIQREQYDKAEQMLHLALRMAQDLQNKDGITYVYDVMANLAMEREQFEKAEKLFVDVMRRLFGDGYTEDSPKVLHISSKIAHMAQLQGNLEKSLQGFKWTLEKLDEKLKNFQDDEEIRELWGLTRNWYGQLLMDLENFSEAKKCFLDAYEIFTKNNGEDNPEVIMILNNLSVACEKLGDITEAKKFLEDALEIAKKFPEMAEAGILKANLGLLYLKEGLINQAREACSFAWKLGKKLDSKATMEQADYCLEAIKQLK